MAPAVPAEPFDSGAGAQAGDEHGPLHRCSFGKPIIVHTTIMIVILVTMVIIEMVIEMIMIIMIK